MNKYIIFIYIWGIFTFTACNDTSTVAEDNKINVNVDSNLSYPEVEEQYKVITVPMVQRQDLE